MFMHHAQFKLPCGSKHRQTVKQDTLAMLQTKTIDKKLEVNGTDLKIVFNLDAGRMESFQL